MEGKSLNEHTASTFDLKSGRFSLLRLCGTNLSGLLSLLRLVLRISRKTDDEEIQFFVARDKQAADLPLFCFYFQLFSLSHSLSIPLAYSTQEYLI